MKVKFVPQNVEFEIKPGESVLHVAQDHGIYVKSVCKGVPSCAECRVRVVEGDHHVLPPGGEELALIGTGHFIDRRRLSCQLKCFGDITVDLSEQIEKQKNLTSDHKLKSKTNIKDDRVEDQHAIRSTDSDASVDDDSPNAVDRESSGKGQKLKESDRTAQSTQQKKQPHPQNRPSQPRQSQPGQSQPRPNQKQVPPLETGEAETDGCEEADGEVTENSADASPGGGGRRRRRRRGRRGGGGQAPGGAPSGTPGGGQSR